MLSVALAACSTTLLSVADGSVDGSPLSDLASSDLAPPADLAITDLTMTHFACGDGSCTEGEQVCLQFHPMMSSRLPPPDCEAMPPPCGGQASCSCLLPVCPYLLCQQPSDWSVTYKPPGYLDCFAY
jgi:hypothetical protein